MNRIHDAARSIAGMALFGVACLSGCEPTAVNCTDVGCSSGLRVELEGTPAPTFTVTAVGHGSEPRTIECAPEDCYLLFTDYAPPIVTIIYEDGERRVEERFEVIYERDRPNGPDCPPECLRATVVLNLGT